MACMEQWNGRAVKRAKWTAGIAPRLLDLAPETAPDLFGDLKMSRRRFVVIDENVWENYGNRILALLARFGIEHNQPLIMSGGEESKTRASVDRILAAMQEFGVPRFGEAPQGWGGGVLHDILGVATGEFRRGVDFDFFGTTLVGAIDAMFALKCAVNEGYKNRTGLYHPARCSWTDPAFFATLSDEDIREGTAEIIKWAVAGDHRLFRLMEQHGAQVVAEKYQGGDEITREIITRTIRGMVGELSGNPYERITARRSYMGHGISPGFEPTLKHGQAVALDVLMTTMIAWRRGLISHAQRERIVQVVASVGLSLWHPVLEDSDRLTTALADTALHRGGQQLITTPHGLFGRRFERPIGRKVTYLELTTAELERARDDLKECAAAADAMPTVRA